MRKVGKGGKREKRTNDRLGWKERIELRGEERGRGKKEGGEMGKR